MFKTVLLQTMGITFEQVGSYPQKKCQVRSYSYLTATLQGSTAHA